MDELAQWIISVGTGALIGLLIVSVAHLFYRLLEVIPEDFRVPFFTPLWNKMMAAIHRMIGH